MGYAQIMEYIPVKSKNVIKNIVGQLKAEGYIITKHSSNFNGVDGGSSTRIWVDEDCITSKLQQMLKAPADETQPAIDQRSNDDSEVESCKLTNVETLRNKLEKVTDKKDYLDILKDLQYDENWILKKNVITETLQNFDLLDKDYIREFFDEAILQSALPNYSE
jgi:hypothetical protein